MAKKNYLNGVILGVTFAILALAASEVIPLISWVGDVIINPLSDWLAGQTWMPEFLSTLSWFNYLVAGLIGMIIGLYVEVK